MENCIQTKLKIITQEQPLRKFQELFVLSDVKSKVLQIFETESCMLNDRDSLHNSDL